MAGAVGGAVRRKSNPVQLGYVDEQVTDKLKDQVDFSTSKIGGQPVRTVLLTPLLLVCHVGYYNRATSVFLKLSGQFLMESYIIRKLFDDLILLAI